MGGYNVDWENAPTELHTWKRVFSETWFNFKQNVNKFAEGRRVYYPINQSLFLVWDAETIESTVPMSSLGRELFVGMQNWIHNLKHTAWGRIDDPEYLDNFALLTSLYTKAKSDAQSAATDEQFKAAWADWVDHCKGVSKSVYDDYCKENEWQREADLHEEILKSKFSETTKLEDENDTTTAQPITHVWKNPLEDSWSFRNLVWPRFPRSKYNKLVPYDVQILDPLFTKLQILHNLSLKVDHLSNVINDMSAKYQNSFISSTSNESPYVLGIVETYQAMLAEVETAKQNKIWTEDEVKFLKRKLFDEVLAEVETLSDRGRLPSLKLLYPDIFR